MGLLEDAPAGLHDVDPPAAQLPPGLPEGLIELYARCDGARLFIDAIDLAPSADVVMTSPAKWRFGTVEGDAVSIDHRGRIWRFDDAVDVFREVALGEQYPTFLTVTAYSRYLVESPAPVEAGA